MDSGELFILFFFSLVFSIQSEKSFAGSFLRFFFSFVFSYYFSYANEGIAFVFAASLLCIKTKVFVLKASFSLFFHLIILGFRTII